MNADGTGMTNLTSSSTASDFSADWEPTSPTATAVSIHILRRGATKAAYLASPGVIPVAIVTTASFDATAVDPSTVCFGDADHPDQRDCTEAHGIGHIADVNDDGRPDLLLHYEANQTGIDPGDTTACLTGKTFGGVAIQGCDSLGMP
jgi:hypothetical protein